MTSTAPDRDHHSPLTVAHTLASHSVDVAHRLRVGEVFSAMDSLLALVDPLGVFLGHVQRCRSAVAQRSPELATATRQYETRLFEVLDRIQDGLDRRDLVGLTLTLEHGVARALRDYEALDAPLCAVLAPRPAWPA